MRILMRICRRTKRGAQNRRFAGRGAVDGGDCPGARSGESHRLPEGSEPHSLGGYSQLHAAGGAINCAGGVMMSDASNERPLYVCSGGTGSRGQWTHERSPVWLKSGNETAAAGHRLPTTHLRLHLFGPQQGRRPCGVIDGRHKRRRPRRAAPRATPSRIERDP